MIQNAASEIRVKNSQTRALNWNWQSRFSLCFLFFLPFSSVSAKIEVENQQQQIFSARRLIEFEERKKEESFWTCTIRSDPFTDYPKFHSFIEFPDPGIKDSIRQQLTDNGWDDPENFTPQWTRKAGKPTFQELFADIVNEWKKTSQEWRSNILFPDHIPVLSREISCIFADNRGLLTNAK